MGKQETTHLPSFLAGQYRPPHLSSPTTFLLYGSKHVWKKKKTAYNLHFKTATMTNYAYLSMRGGQNWSRHLGFPFSIKFRGETQPWSPRLPRSVRSDAEPRAEADFKERLSSSTDVSQHGPRRALDLIQPSQCDTQKCVSSCFYTSC